MKGKSWRIAGDGVVVESLEELKSRMCQHLGLEEGHHEAFFGPQYERDIHDPLLMLGMEAAVERLVFAARKGERVLVYGDYDMDGISATATLVVVLQAWGVNVVPFLPHRMDDGYGLNLTVLKQMKDEFDVVVTVDCGISNVVEVEWLNTQGKDVIVVDHHEVPAEVPPALAVLHPRHPQGNYPWGQLAGAGVTYKLAQGLARHVRFPQAKDADWEKWLLDLPLLGTVGDMMPLLGENRAIVRFGMEVLRRSRRPGLVAMLDAVRIQRSQLTVEDLSFRIIPLFNAAGRIDHPQAGLDVLMATDAAAAQLAVGRLVALNKERQSITRQLTKEAQASIDEEDPVIFAVNTKWPAGVVGLVAGQLARKYGRPAVVVGGNNRHAVGSARSVPGVNILEGLRAAEEHMIKLGGHAEAAGFSAEEAELESVRAILMEYFSNGSKEHQPVLEEARAMVSAHLISWDMWRLLAQFEPFGMGNEKPLFEFTGLKVLQAKPVGKKGEHARLVLGTGEREVSAIAFGLASSLPTEGSDVNVLAALDVNEFGGRAELQLRVEGIAVESEVKSRKYLAGAKVGV